MEAYKNKGAIIQNEIDFEQLKRIMISLGNNFFIDFIARQYGLSESFINKYSEQDRLFLQLAKNENINWTVDLIEKHKDKWKWKDLSWNNSLPWTAKLIEKYEDKWDWDKLSAKNITDWSIDLIETYKDKLHWDRLSWNVNLPWSIELIDKYLDRWDWGKLCWNDNLPWSDYLIEKYRAKWDWSELSGCESLPWSIELIEKFENKWDWSELSSCESLPWSVEFIEKHKAKWDWDYLSFNGGLPWSVEFLEKYLYKWNWNNLSKNEGFPWSTDLLEKYKDKWNWNELSSIKSLPWSIELIEKYSFKNNSYGDWDWSYLSMNENLPWSLDLIESYMDYWSTPFLSSNKSVYNNIIEQLKESKIEEILSHLMNPQTKRVLLIFKNKNIKIDDSWIPFFEKQHVSLNNIEQNIGKYFTPSNPQDIFKIFHLPKDEIRFVIVGQDPYPKENEAKGRSFEREIEAWRNSGNASLDGIAHSAHYFNTGNLLTPDDVTPELVLPPSKWFINLENKHGVFFLNKSLTTKIGHKNSHKDYWNEFTKGLVTEISKDKTIKWLLWGNEAQELEQWIECKENIIKTIHPASHSYVKGEERNRRFNKFVKESGLDLVLKNKI